MSISHNHLSDDASSAAPSADGQQGRGMALDLALLACPVIAIIRLQEANGAVKSGAAVRHGGVRAIEVTLTSPGALDVVRELRAAAGEEGVVGVGSVRSPKEAASAVRAGAQFLVTPTVQQSVLTVAREAGIPVVCGAMTPTELDTAAQLGAAYLKLFPASAFGPEFLRDVLVPLPDLKIIPTGGIGTKNVRAWAEAGACAVAVGSSVIPQALVDAENWNAIEERARALCAAWPTTIH